MSLKDKLKQDLESKENSQIDWKIRMDEWVGSVKNWIN